MVKARSKDHSVHDVEDECPIIVTPGNKHNRMNVESVSLAFIVLCFNGSHISSAI